MPKMVRWESVERGVWLGAFAARAAVRVMLTVTVSLAAGCGAGEFTPDDEAQFVLGSLSEAVVVNEEKCEGPPQAAQLGGRRYLAWVGTNWDKNINLLSSLREGEWSQKSTLAERTNGNGGVGLTVFAGRLWMAWTGTDDKLNVMSSSDGTSWVDKQKLDVARSRVAPAILAHEGRLYIAYTGTDDRLNILRSDDGGRSFGNLVTLVEKSSHSPSLATFEGQLLLGFTGRDSHLNIAELDGEGRALRKATSHETSRDGTFLMGFGHTLIVSWRGNSNEWVNHAPLSAAFVASWLTTGNTGVLPDKRITDERTHRMPTFANFDGSAALLWRGVHTRVNILEYVYEIPRADLTVSLSLDQAQVGVTEHFTLDLVLRNDGPNAAEAPVATLVIPSAARLVSALGSFGASVQGDSGSLTVSLASLPVSATAGAHLVFAAECALEVTTQTFEAHVSSATVDPMPSNDTAAAALAVTPASPELVAPPAVAVTSCFLDGASVDLGALSATDVCDDDLTISARIISKAGASVDLPITDETVFALCDSVVEYHVVNAAGLTATATQTVSVGFEHDGCAQGACCPDGSPLTHLEQVGATYSSRSVSECVLGTAGSDTVSLSGARASFVGGPGSDTLSASGAAQTVRGGEGDDTMAISGGGALVWGNAGDDVMFLARGNNQLVPGPGADVVVLAGGDNTIYILDVCEVEEGEQIEAGSGHDVLVSPVSEAELAALGLTLSGIDEVVIDTSRGCASECRMVSEQCGVAPEL
jgi:hypothetical protein